MEKQVHYSDFLQLEKILGAQLPESVQKGVEAHDEMLFIVVHQAYELWFKQILFEIDSVIEIMKQPSINDNSPQLQIVVHRLSRVVTILKVLVHQIDIMETMTPMDFLEFRDLLRPASGFQSWQFKLIEAKLGLKYEHRHGQQYYVSQLREQEVNTIKKAEKETSLLDLIDSWLGRTPFFQEDANWASYRPVISSEKPGPGGVFWQDYRALYQAGLAEAEKGNLEQFDEVLMNESRIDGRFSARASRAALFIMLYRGYPMLELPFQLLNSVLEIDEQLSTWRYRHINMVHRIIGTRMGTGGSTGKDYLKGALERHYIFADIARLTSFLIQRRKLPKLSAEMERRLGFIG